MPIKVSKNKKLYEKSYDWQNQILRTFMATFENYVIFVNSVAEREVRKLGAALARHTGQEEGEAISHLWGRLGVLLQRGNAAILGNRVPALPAAHIDGVW